MSPDPGAQRGKRFFENILRWEDDGGSISETDHRILPQAAETSIPRLPDVSGVYLL
jgi:hypothetical protein